jgi:RNA polymerase-binding transcription factor DksA
MATTKKTAPALVKKNAPAKAQKPVVTKKGAKPLAKKIDVPLVKKPSVSTAKKTTPAPTPKKGSVAPAAKKPTAAPVAPKVVESAKTKVVPKKVEKPVAKKIEPIAPAKTSKKANSPVIESPKKIGLAPKKGQSDSTPSPTKKTMAKKIVEKKVVEKVVEKEAAPVAVSPKSTAKNPKDIKVLPPKPVLIPKTTTKIAQKYQPDFTKSVLDKPKIDLSANITRYSDSDLIEFRMLINKKLGTAKKELTYLQGLITRKDETGGEEGDNRYLTMEDGSLSMEREQLSQMASRQITFIDHLEKALMRIENKTYGICRITGNLIAKARLEKVPHATLSMEAKMGQR